MPDALELPRMGRAVVPLMRARNTVVDKLIVHRLPRLAAIVRALNQLTKPAAGLRCKQPVGVNRRSLDVVNLPPRKMRTTHVPLFALAIGRQNKSALACANQYSHLTHHPLLLLSLLPTPRA